MGIRAMEDKLRLPKESELRAIFEKRLLEITPQYMFATAVYLAAALEFGVPVWKSLAIAAVVGYAIWIRFGRHILVKAAVFLMMLTLVEWSNVFPPVSQWAAFVGTLLNRNMG
jgi:hypothetical protein